VPAKVVAGQAGEDDVPSKTTIVPLVLMLAGCGGGGRGDNVAAPANGVAENQAAALDGSRAAPALPACAFHDTHDWFGAIENGRLLIQGRVDLQMAGFAPVLTERRSEAPDTIAFDLALSPAPNAPVTDFVQYERAGVSPYRKAAIYCGGERIAAFPVGNFG
jgi:hypothetical protein